MSQGMLCELLPELVPAARPRGWRLQGHPVQPGCGAGGRAAHQDAARQPGRAAQAFVAMFCCLAPPN